MKTIYSRISVLIILLLFFTGAQAQYNVLEQSSKEKPAWYQSAEGGYLIVSAEDESLEACRQKCLETIKSQIIQAVALHLDFAENSKVKQQINNDRIQKFLNIQSTSSTDTVKVSYLNGISLSKVEDSYWEKLKDQKTGKTWYSYIIKYPFPDSELKSLIDEFDKYDKEMISKLKMYEAKLNQIASTEEIEQNIIQLGLLTDCFLDQQQKGKVNILIQSYRKLYSFISIEGQLIKPGEYELHLMLQERLISTSQIPGLKSNCASQLKASIKPPAVIVNYDTTDCLMGKDNFVEVTFRLHGQTIKYLFYIK